MGNTATVYYNTTTVGLMLSENSVYLTRSELNGEHCNRVKILTLSNMLFQMCCYNFCSVSLIFALLKSPATINMASGYVISSLHEVQCSSLRALSGIGSRGNMHGSVGLICWLKIVYILHFQTFKVKCIPLILLCTIKLHYTCYSIYNLNWLLGLAYRLSQNCRT